MQLWISWQSLQKYFLQPNQLIRKSKQVHVAFSYVQREDVLLVQGLLFLNSKAQVYLEDLIVQIWRQIHCLR